MNFDKTLFHPFLVHFPIALCFFEFFILGLSRFKKENGGGCETLCFARLTFHVLAVCLIATLIAGWHDAGGTLEDLFQSGVRPHVYSAGVLSVIVAGRLALWKRFHPGHPQSFRVHFIGSMVMMIASAVTAYWGGELVYG